MTVGLSIQPSPDAPNAIDDLVEQAEEAHALGITTVWLSQQFAQDALTAAAVVAARVPDVRIGTSVVTIGPRHPITVAAQAKTVQAASHGRFSLGLGLGAASIEVQTYGLDADHPALRLRDHLTALVPLLAGETTEYEGPTVTSRPLMSTAVAGSDGIRLLVAAMGPEALRVTGELADGTIPLYAGPRTLAEYLVPTISKAAAGRDREPVIVAGVAVTVTSDPDQVRANAVEQMAFYERIPSYQRIIAREGAKHAHELAVIGDEATVTAELQRYRDAGATELLITQTTLGGPEDRRRTLELLGSLAA